MKSHLQTKVQNTRKTFAKTLAHLRILLFLVFTFVRRRELHRSMLNKENYARETRHQFAGVPRAGIVCLTILAKNHILLQMRLLQPRSPRKISCKLANENTTDENLTMEQWIFTKLIMYDKLTHYRSRTKFKLRLYWCFIIRTLSANL